ncbi:helix-turn-helix transcriptional regulator [Flavobacterium sp. ov086]|uniref:helix-turn-helix transcriptional regulator n=1 Tax=Flavobacterium sp. ov086 TaxID=1761785 RepID=UPI000B77BB34|nr:helix-turn-helix transcriptional regulator [Flavobacterium sp. ov086]
MTHTKMIDKKIHHGRNIKRFREMLGIKQEVLAFELGEDWNQKKISVLEQKELIENDILDQVAKILKVPADAIKNFDEEQAINIISNNASFDNCQQPAFFNNQPTFNPLDKMVELYERMLEQQKEMIDRLEKLIREK